MEDKAFYNFSFTIYVEGGSYYVRNIDRIAPTKVSGPLGLSGEYARGWLSTQKPKDYNQVVSRREGREILFIHLKELQNQIGSMSLPEALKFLQDKIDSTKSEVSLLGFSLEERIVIWVGPTVILVLLLFLLVHVKHLHLIWSTSDIIAKTFPWMPLFSGRLSRLLTFASIVCLPVVSNIMLLVRSNEWSEPAAYWGSMLTIAILFCGVTIIRCSSANTLI